MLRDPHHDLNLFGFRDFVAKQDADAEYNYGNARKCACAQFARHIGLYDEWLGTHLFDPGIWSDLNRLAFGDAFFELHTWGALRERIDYEIFENSGYAYPVPPVIAA